MMPIWYIREVEVVNNQYYSTDEIIESADIGQVHLLDLSFRKAEKNIKILPYISDVEIKYTFPSKLVINVVEKTPFAYVMFMGNYLCLNEQGQVIEESNQKRNKLPVISGIKFTEFKLSEILPIENQESWLLATEIINILKKHNYVENVEKIDVYNMEEIHLYVDKLDVIMGDIGDFDQKIQWLIEIHKELDMGKLDLSTVVKNGQATLSSIT